MPTRPLHRVLAAASLAIVLCAAAFSRSENWDFSFAQYRGPQRPEPKDEFRFVMVGDRTGGRVPGLMPQAFREINHLYPDFVVSVGDLSDGPANTEERINQFWKEFDDEVSILQSPFVYVPGNHDVWNATSKGIYEQRYGPTYRSFDYRGLHFITLDTEEFDQNGRKIDRIDGEQLEWLRRDIERNRNARAILVLMHKPIWHTGGLAKAHEIWKGLPVYVFAGHVHRYSYEVIDGIPHIILGAVAGGMREEGDAIGRFRHYMLVTVRDAELKFALIRLGGVLAPEVVVEGELPGIRLLADATALWLDEPGQKGSARLVARNPLKTPVKIQVQSTNYGPAKPVSQMLLRGVEPTVAADESFATELAYGGTNSELKAIFEFQNVHGQPQRIDFPLEPRTRRTIRARTVPRPPAIDGDLADWAGANWQSLDSAAQLTAGDAQWKGANDLAAKFAIAHDDEHVYLAIDVRDDVVASHTSPRDADGIELLLAGPAQGEISFARDPDWHQLVISPFRGDVPAPGDPSGTPRASSYGPRKIEPARAAFRREANGYVLELAFLRADLGWTAEETQPQIDLVVNDRDVGTSRETQMTWAGTARAGFSSRHHGTVQWGDR